MIVICFQYFLETIRRLYMLNNLKRKKEINQLLILGKKKYKTLIILKKCKFIKILPKLH